MSLTKKWKLILASLSFAFFTACAGGSNGGSGDAGYAGDDSAGHVSALFYTLEHMFGYGISLDDLKNFLISSDVLQASSRS